jgi:hypothetical protein
MALYIKYLPKDRLLFELWKRARRSQHFYYCPHLMPKLDLVQCRKDINMMIASNDKIEVCTYFGRLVYVDITGDYLDSFNYDVHNGDDAALSVVTELKKEELLKAVLRCAVHK